ncbi:MAG: hypothetical protein AB8G16_14495 [Gammaproteobacteria bacterium]
MSTAGAPRSDTPELDATVNLARRMTFALGLRDEEDFRLAVLKRVARRFGDDNYPEFIRLLLIIACSHDVRAKRRVSSALAIGLRRTDLPSGRLSSWGASTLSQPSEGVTASELSGQFFRGAPQRQLGPLEYLTVWHHQRTQRETLGREAYCFALSQLIELLNHDDEARKRYITRLTAESERQIEGAYTGASRDALARLSTAWSEGEAASAIAQATAKNSDAAEPGSERFSDWVVRPL